MRTGGAPPLPSAVGRGVRQHEPSVLHVMVEAVAVSDSSERADHTLRASDSSPSMRTRFNDSSKRINTLGNMGDRSFGVRNVWRVGPTYFRGGGGATSCAAPQTPRPVCRRVPCCRGGKGSSSGGFGGGGGGGGPFLLFFFCVVASSSPEKQPGAGDSRTCRTTDGWRVTDGRCRMTSTARNATVPLGPQQRHLASVRCTCCSEKRGGLPSTELHAHPVLGGVPDEPWGPWMGGHILNPPTPRPAAVPGAFQSKTGPAVGEGAFEGGIYEYEAGPGVMRANVHTTKDSSVAPYAPFGSAAVNTSNALMSHTEHSDNRHGVSSQVESPVLCRCHSLRGVGMGGLEPKSRKVRVPKIAQINISFCKFHFFTL